MVPFAPLRVTLFHEYFFVPPRHSRGVLLPGPVADRACRCAGLRLPSRHQRPQPIPLAGDRQRAHRGGDPRPRRRREPIVHGGHLREPPRRRAPDRRPPCLDRDRGVRRRAVARQHGRCRRGARLPAGAGHARRHRAHQLRMGDGRPAHGRGGRDIRLPGGFAAGRHSARSHAPREGSDEGPIRPRRPTVAAATAASHASPCRPGVATG